MELLESPAKMVTSRGEIRILVSDTVDLCGLEPLRAVARLDVRTGMSPADLKATIGDYDALVVRSQTQVTAEILAAGVRLQAVGRAGVGIDNIDVEAATRLGIVVLNAPDGNTLAAAEHTMAMMLALSRQVAAADASVRRGEWQRSAFTGTELAGKSLGIIGLGRIGRHVAGLARAFGMRILAHDPFIAPDQAHDLALPLVDLEALLAEADYITLHVPKTPHTSHLVNAERLASAKQGVRIINCARGGLVDEAALVAAIERGHVAGAALDVFESEPQVAAALKALGPRLLLTPHLGASTVEAQVRVAHDVAVQLATVLQGEEAIHAVRLRRPKRPVALAGA